MYAVFQRGRQVSKAHPNRYAAEIEAHEKGLVLRAYRSGPVLANGVEIKEIIEQPSPFTHHDMGPGFTHIDRDDCGCGPKRGGDD